MENLDIHSSYIDEIKIKNFICIDNAKMKCNKSKEVYILGENGDGKTLLLEAIYLTFSKKVIEQWDMSKDVANAIDLLNLIKKTNTVLKGTDTLNNYELKNDECLPNVYAYGTHRGRIGSIDENDFEKVGFMTLFDSNKKLINPSAWIKEVDYRDLKNQESSENSRNALNSIQSIFDGLLDKKVDITISNYEVRYIENGAQVSFDQLSEGYRTTLIFVCDLLYRFYGYKMPKDFNGVFDAKGVVLIDEIDAHLHPRWQRTIVSRIRKLFPEVQFIMTTHSPHIIQGAGQDAVIFRVYRDGESGKTCVSEPYLRSELNYMMINTLATSPLFGLESARLKVDNDTDYTSSTYLMDRIEKKVQDRIKKRNLKNLITDDMIDNIIDSVLDEDDN